MTNKAFHNVPTFLMPQQSQLYVSTITLPPHHAVSCPLNLCSRCYTFPKCLFAQTVSNNFYLSFLRLLTAFYQLLLLSGPFFSQIPAWLTHVNFSKRHTLTILFKAKNPNHLLSTPKLPLLCSHFSFFHIFIT